MKRVLFWCLFPFGAVLMIAVGIIGALCDHIGAGMSALERWLLDYEKRGWVHKGDGIYMYDPDKDQTRQQGK